MHVGQFKFKNIASVCLRTVAAVLALDFIGVSVEDWRPNWSHHPLEATFATFQVVIQVPHLILSITKQLRLLRYVKMVLRFHDMRTDSPI